MVFDCELRTQSHECSCSLQECLGRLPPAVCLFLTAQGLSWYLIIHHHSTGAQKPDRALLQAFASPCSGDVAAKRSECFKPPPHTVTVICTLLAVHSHQPWKSQAHFHGNPAGIHGGGLCQSRVMDPLLLLRKLRLYSNIFSGKGP